MTKDRFELREEHLTLLQRAYVQWNDCEFGAPEIDPKRPYGNSGVAYSVAEILGIPVPDDEKDPGAYEAWYERMCDLHRETEQALQIVLYTRSFVPGVYKLVGRYTPTWVLAEKGEQA